MSEQAAAEELHYTGWTLFVVSGPDLNPELITQMLGIEPDRAVVPSGDREGAWQINSTRGADESIEDHIWEILHRLVGVRRKLRELSKDLRLEFYCAIEKDGGEIIHIVLPPRLMLFIGYLGARIVWDVSDRDQGASS